ncbi:unnamed protein product [Acanthoscelides obtectus]|uniref:Uncharacterized protein n=1 Tax=Acanthoscelides obtectus TaxID=200917 RepID=A0A9P0LHB3_ACAOB|nr:unnamed protein product [Acanthoscelides obtectus]CAH1965277.1 unnamed protein product [Acanthoscelides obtectus]CAH1993079.1 unnamed protein product [Acanthoscelides obtectus]CAH1997196.1 unnamed protein product [Acanthoscelides obtectus]CAK1627543.1 hypothetical protein AOBTE_LOCUS4654 [Acanthoscelides obtectus]
MKKLLTIQTELLRTKILFLRKKNFCHHIKMLRKEKKTRTLVYKRPTIF